MTEYIPSYLPDQAVKRTNIAHPVIVNKSLKGRCDVTQQEMGLVGSFFL